MTSDPATSDPARAGLVLGRSGRDSADEALLVAADLAARLDAELHVVHGVDVGDHPADSDADERDEAADLAVEAHRAHIEATLDGSGVRWTFRAERGDPVHLLIAAADETDALMIILGSRGESVGASVERALGGSVSRAVLRKQHRPVLVVPTASDG
jgi:nucleotide-binding universal stress UspA family protein